MRKDFDLPEEDMDFLDTLGLPWETVMTEGTIRRLVIYEYPVPPGYKVPKVALNLRIEKGYADTPLNTVYFYPPLSRMDEKIIGALSDDLFDGKVWQRWSRHRTQENPWRAGIDSIRTHIDLVNFWLRREFLIRP